MRNSITVLFLAAFMLAACVDIPKYDDTPSIAFNSLTKYVVPVDTTANTKDSIIVTIDFTDGDGDLGAGREDHYPDWGNYRLRTFIVKPDNSELELNLSLDKFMFFPPLKPDGKPGPIKGKLDFGLVTGFPYQQRGNVLVPLKLRIKIRDKALRESQEVETDTIWTPMPSYYLEL